MRQPRDGYRFSLDALLLAWYASILPGQRFLELGAGCGVVSLALAFKRPELTIDAVEFQRSLAELAEFNVESNGLDSVRVVEQDFRSLSGRVWEGRFDVVLSNPPYRAVGRGRLNPDAEKARARHELLCTLDDVLACAKCCVVPGGFVALVMLAERYEDLRLNSAKHGLGIIHICWILPNRDRDPNLFLALLSPVASAKPQESGLTVYTSPNHYTPELQAILAGEWDRFDHPLSDFMRTEFQKE